MKIKAPNEAGVKIGKRVRVNYDDYFDLFEEFKKAVKFIREGKQKFTPSTTNSLVDEFLKDHAGL